jgi:NAD(P)-dependent dehydrogenase (short-subunit alcohol dehydrogenase family)
MEDLSGKVAFITGGGSGIGLGMATAFLKRGMKVVIGDIRADRLARARTSLAAISDQVETVEVDTTRQESLVEAARFTESKFGHVHILCNNAGVGGGGKVLDVPMDRWHQVIDINLWGVLHGIRAFLPAMLQHGEGGHVVNTASFTGIVGHHSQSNYGTSKFAVVGLSEFLRNDLEGEKVSVSVLCPHLVDTPIFYGDLDDTDTEAIAKRKQSMPWFTNIARDPEDVGNMVIRGIETDELYIFCDGTESREMLEGRSKRLFDAMDRQFPTN